jgi:uncharacterized membrane protein YoaT (DUF817 family)
MRTPTLERQMGGAIRGRLPGPLAELALFVVKQGWAALFGGLLLLAILGTRAVWQDGWPVHRYDALFLFALAVQALFLRARLETWEEARVILLFHATGTAMEWFKVQAGSWDYPEPGLFKLFEVPLFSGYMYASVGSYMARVIRIFDMRFAPCPPFAAMVALACAIYVNFFAHHFLPDIRVVLFAATLGLFRRTRIWFRIDRDWRWMPLPVAAFLSACALWLAELVGTVTRTWVYAGTGTVSPGKLGSWYLLLFVAFVTVTAVVRGVLHPAPPAMPTRPPARAFRPARASTRRPQPARPRWQS